VDVEADATHVLLGKDTLLGGPLEARNARILDLSKVLHGLGNIDEDVGASGVGAKAPDLAGIGDVPAVVVLKYIFKFSTLGTRVRERENIRPCSGRES